MLATFISNLNDLGIYIGARVDRLQWDGITKDRSLKVNEIYKRLPTTEYNFCYKTWYSTTWGWGVLMKLLCFRWLAIHHIILTWDNFQGRGYHVPCIWSMCRTEEEKTNHMFIRCNFAKEVWKGVATILKLRRMNTQSTLEHWFNKWFKALPELWTLPFYVIWANGIVEICGCLKERVRKYERWSRSLFLIFQRSVPRIQRKK